MPARRLLLVLFSLYALRIWISSRLGLHADEAYYWVWSRHLAWGYFDHPPMIAWIIRIGDDTVGALLPEAWRASQAGAQIAMRALPMLLTAVVTPYFLVRAIERLQRKPIDAAQGTVLLSTPLFVLGPMIVTPDAPFFAAWAGALYLVLRFPSAWRKEATPWRPSLAVGLGICLGIAGLSKYSAVLAAVLVVGARIGIANLFVAGGVALAIFAPHLAWQIGGGAGAQDGGLFFQLRNGLGSRSGAPNWSQVGDLWLTQALFWSPALFLGSLVVAFRRAPEASLSRRLLAWAFLPVLFFSWAALHRRPEGNWPLVGCLAAIVLVLAFARGRKGCLLAIGFSNLLVLTVGFALVGGASTLAPLASAWPRLRVELEKPSRAHEFEAWRDLHAQAFRAMASDSAPVRVQSYQLLSTLLFFDAIAPAEKRFGDRLKIWSEASRASQFDAWEEYRFPLREHPAHWRFVSGPHLPDDRPPCPVVELLEKGDARRPFRVIRCEAGQGL